MMEKVLSERNLLNFVRFFWQFVEPGRKFTEGWVVEAICEHLEAVTYGQIDRLLINVSPGRMKSLTTNVFWPAWEWGPMGMSSVRYVCASYSQDLTIRDNMRFRQVITSDIFQSIWGDQFTVISPNIEKVINNRTGWKLATSIKGLGTGERGDRVICDDPNNIQKTESEKDRAMVNHYFREVLPTRLNDPTKDAIIVIQQRTHEEDVSGLILSTGMAYEHLMIPQRYESTRHCVTSIGWQDPRGLDEEGNPLSGKDLDAADGLLDWPERFPLKTVTREENILGEYAVAGQFQQSPVPRGGGIFKRHWWQIFPPSGWEGIIEDKNQHKIWQVKYPEFDFVCASLDTAYTEKQENDYSALVIWGVWRDSSSKRYLPTMLEMDERGALRLPDDERPRIMLVWGWQKRLELHGPPDDKPPGMTAAEWNGPAKKAERMARWGLVEWVVDACRSFQVDSLVIEGKAAGLSVAQEIERLYANEDFGVHVVNPEGDKIARAYSVQHLFSNGQIYAPMYYDGNENDWRHPPWCEKVLDQLSVFPKTAHDDIVDAAVQGLRWMRDQGMAKRREEAQEEFQDLYQYGRKPTALYDV